MEQRNYLAAATTAAMLRRLLNVPVERDAPVTRGSLLHLPSDEGGPGSEFTPMTQDGVTDEPGSSVGVRMKKEIRELLKKIPR